MGRKKDTEKAKIYAQVEALGVLVRNRHYTKQELKDIIANYELKQSELKRAAALTEVVAGPVPTNMTSAELPIPYEAHNVEDPFNGLTDRQKLIARLRMRGLSQQAIANVVKVSQPYVYKELVAIKSWQIERGRRVDQEEVVGGTASLYEEVEHRAWELYHGAEESSEKAKALTVVMQAREKHTKLLMDLGLLKKAAHEVNHTLEVSPFVSRFQESGAREFLGNSIVMEQLKALEAPTPDCLEDAEVIEDEEEPLANGDDLEAPTPDTEDDLL